MDAAVVGAGAQLHRCAGGLQRAQEVAEEGLRGAGKLSLLTDQRQMANVMMKQQTSSPCPCKQ